MTYVLGYNVISPLGTSAAENFDAVRSGHSSLCRWHNHLGVPDDFSASLFGGEDWQKIAIKGYTRLESLAIRSARKAMAQTEADIQYEKTIFILSSTKGNVELLSKDEADNDRCLLGNSAVAIAKALGISSVPIVADNACVSGLAAIILADRLLESGACDRAVVCGAEVQSRFIVSGFGALKSLSPDPCRPFDIDRNGLNLGEAAATLVLGRKPCEGTRWHIGRGAVRNDAFHISAPSKTGEGARLALKEILKTVPEEDVAFVNAHGTATLFNDQMESLAIERAGLSDIPVNAFKGNFGHTMGACGILETIVSMCALDRGIVLPTKGFSHLGVSGKIRVAAQEEKTGRRTFIKMLSGFGGVNAALAVGQGATGNEGSESADKTYVVHHVRMTTDSVEVDGSKLAVEDTGKAMITNIYKRYIGDYPRFYKMDLLCRIAFVASELLVNAEGGRRFMETDDRAVVLAGRRASLHADMRYLETIASPDGYYPSPERFVYTLPNIMTGEIAIRNHYHGETSYYVLPERDDGVIKEIMAATFMDSNTRSILGGWIDCGSDNEFEADLNIISRWKN